jgi:hypothetical protein
MRGRRQNAGTTKPSSLTRPVLRLRTLLPPLGCALLKDPNTVPQDSAALKDTRTAAKQSAVITSTESAIALYRMCVAGEEDQWSCAARKK